MLDKINEDDDASEQVIDCSEGGGYLVEKVTTATNIRLRLRGVGSKSYLNFGGMNADSIPDEGINDAYRQIISSKNMAEKFRSLSREIANRKTH